MLCTLGRDSHPLVFHAAFSGTFPAHTGKTPSLAREGARRFSQTLPLAASEGASQLSTLRACGGAVSVGGPGVAPGSVLRPTCRHSNRVGRRCRRRTGLLRVPPRLPEGLPAGTTREAELCIGLPAARSSCLVPGFFPLYLLS